MIFVTYPSTDAILKHLTLSVEYKFQTVGESNYLLSILAIRNCWLWMMNQEKKRKKDKGKARLYPRSLKFLKIYTGKSLGAGFYWPALIFQCSISYNYLSIIIYFQQGPSWRKPWLRVPAKLAPCVLVIILTFTVTTHLIVYLYIEKARQELFYVNTKH